MMMIAEGWQVKNGMSLRSSPKLSHSAEPKVTAMSSMWMSLSGDFDPTPLGWSPLQWVTLVKSPVQVERWVTQWTMVDDSWARRPN